MSEKIGFKKNIGKSREIRYKHAIKHKTNMY